MPDYDLNKVKKTFFENVIQVTSSARRMVAWCDGLEHTDSQGEQAGRIVKIWVPERWDDDYNLVLSLASNGKHYALMDWDSIHLPAAGKDVPEIWGTDLAQWFRSSSGMWHGYLRWGASFEPTVMAATFPRYDWDGIQKIPDPGEYNPYADHTRDKGFSSLRPPWVVKQGAATPWIKYKDALPDSFIAKMNEQPDEPDGIGWEDLFND